MGNGRVVASEFVTFAPSDGKATAAQRSPGEHDVLRTRADRDGRVALLLEEWRLVPWRRGLDNGGVAFVADDLGAWLVGLLADAGRRKLVALVLGDEQVRALHQACRAALAATAAELRPGDAAAADEVAMVVGEVFKTPAPQPTGEHGTVLGDLRAGIAAQLAVLDDPDITTQPGWSSANALGVSAAEVAETLASRLVREIIGRGARGGPLEPLANLLGHDRSFLQGLRLEGKIDHMDGLLAAMLAVLDEARPGSRGQQLVVGEIPRKPPGYVVRGAVDVLAERISRQGRAVVCALTGIRGVGKIHIAAAYARDRVDQGCGLVGWVDAETHDGLLAGLARVATRLGVADPAGDSLESARRLREHLDARAGPGLLVFDNATDPDGLRPFLPATGGTLVLITTTDMSFAGLGSLIEVGPFSRAESVTYLQDRTERNDRAGAAAVAEELGDLPVALAQAAHKIWNNKQLTYLAYLEELRRVPLAELLGRGRGEDYRDPAAAALLLSIQAAEADDPSGLTELLLRVIAALSPDGVRRDLLGGLRIGEPAGESRVPDTAVERSVAGSLLTWSVSSDRLIMHRLLGRVLRDRDMAAGRWPDTVAICLALVEPRLFDKETAWTRREEGNELVIQIEALFANTPEGSSPDLARRLLQARSWAVQQLQATSDLGRAISLGKEVAAGYERILGDQHLATCVANDDVAHALLAANQIEESVTLYKRVLAERERALGDDHPDTITSRSNLAYAYYCAHRWDESILLYEGVLQDRERVLGSEHPDTMKARHGLGSAYVTEQRFNEGISLLGQTLEDCDRVLGPVHPVTLGVCRSLGIAYFPAYIAPFYKRYDRPDPFWTDEALKLLERTLNGREQELGSDHPDTIGSLLDLGAAYFRVAGWDAAISLFQRALAISERVLGADHPKTVTARVNLENLTQLIGEAPE